VGTKYPLDFGMVTRQYGMGVESVGVTIGLVTNNRGTVNTIAPGLVN
jgi:hypothetical protein